MLRMNIKKSGISRVEQTEKIIQQTSRRLVDY